MAPRLLQNAPQMLPGWSRNRLEGIWKATWKQKTSKERFQIGFGIDVECDDVFLLIWDAILDVFEHQNRIKI